MSRRAWVEETPFDPLDDPAYEGLTARIGETIIDEILMNHPVRPLAALPMFQGAGLYMLYYTGEHMPFRAYEALASENRGGHFTAPIYVGKSERSATRTGATEPDGRSDAIHNRLSKHKTSIRQAVNLDLADFYCQYLVLEDAFIRLGEHCLIRRYHPLWNSCVSGFGSNAGRRRPPRRPAFHVGYRPSRAQRGGVSPAQQIVTRADIGHDRAGAR